MNTQRIDISRRHLLGGLGLFGGYVLATPGARAHSLFSGLSSDEGETERTLVVVQLTGGNDGLSTVMPFADDAYNRARPRLRHDPSKVLGLDEYRGLHPFLKQLHARYEEGQVAIVEGLGYPDASRSHFRSYETWHTGRLAGRASGDGWLGRLAAHAGARGENPERVVHLGRRAPYSVYSATHPAVVLESPTTYKWLGDDAQARAWARAGEEEALMAESDPEGAEGTEGAESGPAAPTSGSAAALQRLRGVLDDARRSSRKIRSAVASYRPSVEYPRNELTGALHDVAALIHSGLGSLALSVSIGGFDTHAAHRAHHDRLMGVLDGALGAFLTDLEASEAGRNTIVLVFSEFGRRVAENGSGGLDHGRAGPALVLGNRIKGGVYGEHPSLTELDEGDLAYTTDFRSVYGTLIEKAFDIPHERVLGERFPLLEFV